MMDRNSSRRIRQLAGPIAKEKKRQERDWEKMEKHFWPRALIHGIAVAAIVLRGEPKIDEPLQLAWVRAAERFGFDRDFVRTRNYTHVACEIVPKIIKSERNWSFLSEIDLQAPPVRELDEDYEPILIAYRLPDGTIVPECEPASSASEETEVLSEIFHAAPAWLLRFTAVALDALFLKFELPDLSGPIEWGQDGFEEAMRWPELPLGTISAGEPKNSSPFDCLPTEDLIFLMRLRERSEGDWSLTERRRHEAIFKQVWRHAEGWKRGRDC